MITISAVARASDNRPRQFEYETVGDLVEVLGKRKSDTKDGPAIIGATFTTGEHKITHEVGVWRRTECVDQVTALILDVDHGVTDVDDFLELWPWEGVAWSTWSHGVACRVCLRVLLPLAEPIDATAHAALWRWAERRSGHVIDASCKDPTRLYFAPRQRNPESAEEPWVRLMHGTRLTVSTLDLAPPPTPKHVPAPRGETSEDEVESALSALDPDCDYHEWLAIGMGVHDALGAAGLHTWEAWSRRGAKYKEGDCASRWSSFGPGSVTKSTIFGLARSAGWRPEPAAKPQAPRATPDAGTADNREPLQWASHVAIAKHVLRTLRARGPICDDESKVWQYADPVWSPLRESDLRKAVHALDEYPVVSGRDKETGLVTTKPLRVVKALIDGVLCELRTLIDKDGFFASAPIGVQFADCFVQITGGQIRRVPSEPAHRQRVAHPWDYDPWSPCPRWERALAEWFDGDEDAGDKIDLLQEFAGASMAGIATKYARALVLLGEGANGKSVVIDALQHAFPAGCWSSIEPQDFANEYRLALLSGPRVNFAADIPAAEIVGSSAFKAVVSGDVVTARHIRQDPFQFRPLAGHIFSANSLPRTRDYSHGFWRRFLVLEFARQFAIDPGLVIELRKEAQGIASWALRGVERLLLNGGYTIPASSERALAAWKTESDVVAMWLEERGSATGAGGTLAGILWEDFKEWSDLNRYRPLGSRTFFERLQGVVGKPKRSSQGKMYPVSVSRVI